MNLIIILGAKYLYLIVILGFLFAFFIEKKKKDFLTLTIFTLPVAFIIGKILNHFINDPRPFVVEKTVPLIAHAADNGFPSDHTLLSMSLALIVFIYNKKWGSFLIILALIVGLFRVFAKVHHLLDILGSVAIAVFAIYLALLILKKLKQQRVKPKLQTLR